MQNLNLNQIQHQIHVLIVCISYKTGIALTEVGGREVISIFAVLSQFAVSLDIGEC